MVTVQHLKLFKYLSKTQLSLFLLKPKTHISYQPLWFPLVISILLNFSRFLLFLFLSSETLSCTLASCTVASRPPQAATDVS